MDHDLEQLMRIHQPSDLTSQVAIPNERNRAHGGLADVYAGLLSGKEVNFSIIPVSWLLNPSRLPSKY